MGDIMKKNIVALVDSGVNLPGYENFYENIEISNKKKCKVINQYADESGHGSSCAKMILEYGRDVYIRSVRMLNEDNQARYLSLKAILNALLESDVKVINLSLSTYNQRAEELQSLCKEIVQRGKIIIAANDNSGKNSYPAKLPDVIGVAGLRTLCLNEYWYNCTYTIQCVADASPIILRGSSGRLTVFGGTSKAATVMTACVTKILAEYGDLNYDEITRVLEKRGENRRWDRVERTCVSEKVPSYSFLSTKDKYVKEIAGAVSKVVGKNISETQLKKNTNILLYGISIENCTAFLEELEKCCNITINKPLQYYRILELSSIMGIIEEFSNEKM